jgi:hypothetical protein
MLKVGMFPKMVWIKGAKADPLGLAFPRNSAETKLKPIQSFVQPQPTIIRLSNNRH